MIIIIIQLLYLLCSTAHKNSTSMHVHVWVPSNGIECTRKLNSEISCAFDTIVVNSRRVFNGHIRTYAAETSMPFSSQALSSLSLLETELVDTLANADRS